MTLNALMDNIPFTADPAWVIGYLDDGAFDKQHIRALKEISGVNNIVLSEILGVTPKTFNTYSKDISKIKIDTKEHILLLLSLMKKGSEVFAGQEEFNEWLQSPNVFFDNREPVEFLNTISGIKFVDSRLIAMEYGDNV
jgi:uncharacterized protein (DUF2384 family)